ncbi:ribosomal L7Ae/L30e/S12e/Gadd45 family protein [uncultured Phascolarctobacterium sp.]|uniref:L7Ae/L30e/S12e/Gadd45 family ribosomal protein n=1 Tax=uncultured Phascolarctobacterium sp. TaxID=512296 RepID=UPI002631D4B2|nr:ribosomal L7Ae/L30e/S12e/Gadd45 family protein [uncultured Phascolarctobacterium sp.]
MTLEALKQAEQRTVGVKQTEKAVLKQAAEVVYIACDADERVTGKLLALCQEKQVPTVTTEAMLEIGRACSINVKAAAAAILKA